MQRPEAFVFAGPSLSSAARARLLPGFDALLAPAKRGDIQYLADSRSPGTIVLADGRFHQSISVGHAELREAVRRGWKVWGVSSIGAIRAYELRDAGIRGFGRVYRLFYRFRDFQDDEVAVLNDVDPPYAAASEPLVHLRFALATIVRENLISPERALAILRELKSLWFGDRSLPLFRRLALGNAASRSSRSIERHLDSFDRFRVKQKDLAALLAARPWEVSSRSRP